MFRLAIVVIAATCVFGLPKDLMFRGLEGRIKGGHKAVLGQFPYIAELSINKEHACGGTILNSRWILTAAHCVRRYDAAQFRVKVGTTTLDAGGDIYYLEKLEIHPEDTPATKENDLALVRTTADIQFTDNVQPLPIADYEIPEGTDVVASGWGYTSYGIEPIIPNDLHYINLKTYNIAKCGLSLIWWGNVGSDNICTYTHVGEGICGGDSGGPLVHDGHLVGTISWGVPCGDGYPDVYTKSFAYLDWINLVITKEY